MTQKFHSQVFIYQRNKNICPHKDMQRVIAALLVTVKNKQQPKHRATDKRVKQYVYSIGQQKLKYAANLLNMDEGQKYYNEQNKQDTSECLLYECIYKKFQKKLIYRDKKQINNLLGQSIGQMAY